MEWIDVTTSFRWRGNPVGIVRTEIEFAKRFISLRSAQLCIFNQGKWVQISNETYLNSFCDSSVELGAKEKAKSSRVLSLKLEMVLFLKRLLGAEYGPFKDAFFQGRNSVLTMFRLIKGRTLRVLRILKLIPSEKKVKAVVRGESPFRPGDTYICMGLDWDDKDLSLMYEIKERLNLKIVSVCYDLIPYFYPQFLVPGYSPLLSSHFGDLVWLSDKIMCISNATRQDLIRFSNEVCLRDVSSDFFYLGSSFDTRKDEIISQITGDSFCLSVSTIEPRKNYHLLYLIWDRLVEKYGKEKVHKLIIVGRVGWLSHDLLHLIRTNPNTKDMIEVRSHVSDNELSYLYRTSKFTVFPSFVEGWGLPVAESLAFGKVCISSSTSSLPEASQGCGVHIDPFDFSSWFATIEKAMFEPDYISEMESKIKNQFKPISWDESFLDFCNKGLQ